MKFLKYLQLGSNTNPVERDGLGWLAGVKSEVNGQKGWKWTFREVDGQIIRIKVNGLEGPRETSTFIKKNRSVSALWTILISEAFIFSHLDGLVGP